MKEISISAMKGYKFPCQGCDKRHLGCHGTCNDYISTVKKIEELKKKGKNY